MENVQTVLPNRSESEKSNNYIKWITVALLIYLLICAVGIIGSGFKMSVGGHAKELFAFASNPFAGLVVGIVATALIQSSSTVTSIIVGLVAGGLPVELAVPMVMGANVGTSITNTIVSLGHVRAKEEFKRAFSAATVHDFFNLLSVVIFLPLEIAFGFLEKTKFAPTCGDVRSAGIGVQGSRDAMAAAWPWRLGSAACRCWQRRAAPARPRAPPDVPSAED